MHPIYIISFINASKQSLKMGELQSMKDEDKLSGCASRSFIRKEALPAFAKASSSARWATADKSARHFFTFGEKMVEARGVEPLSMKESEEVSTGLVD